MVPANVCFQFSGQYEGKALSTHTVPVSALVHSARITGVELLQILGQREMEVRTISQLALCLETGERERERERETDRQTDRQTERQRETDRETERDRDRDRDRETDRQTDRERDGERDSRQTYK